MTAEEHVCRTSECSDRQVDLTVDERLAAAAALIAAGEDWLYSGRYDLAQAAAALADSHLSHLALAAEHGPHPSPGPVGFAGGSQ